MSELLDSSAAMFVLVMWLGAAALIDFHRHRIPNSCCLGIIATGTALQLTVVGIPGLGVGLAGFGAGLVLLLPFYARGGMGAGDVKLMAAAGTFLGPYGALAAGLFALIAGGVIALGVIAYSVIASSDAIGALKTARSARFPYAAAIGAGSLALILLSESTSLSVIGGTP
jgi:prepilin peptidase CpaA